MISTKTGNFLQVPCIIVTSLKFENLFLGGLGYFKYSVASFSNILHTYYKISTVVGSRILLATTTTIKIRKKNIFGA